MKPASFEYERPAHLDEACALLSAGDDVRIIAGGQTLVPLMAMRLARPKRLIDIARIPELAFVRDEGSAVVDRRDHPPMRARARRHRPRQGTRCSPRSCRSSVMPRSGRGEPWAARSPTRDPAAEIALAAVTLAATLVYREGDNGGRMCRRGFLHRADDDGAARGRAA